MWVSTSDFRLLLTRVSSRQLIQRYLVRVVEDGLRLGMAAYDDARARASADSGAAPITHGMARDESGAPQVTIALLQRINPSSLLFKFLCFSLFLSHVQGQEQAELLQPPTSSALAMCVGGVCILYDRRGLEYHHIDPRLQVDRPLKPANLLVALSPQSHLAPCFTDLFRLSHHQRQCRATIDALRVGYTTALLPKHLPLPALSLTTTTFTCVPCSFCGG
jgi:hypothetical protein